MRLSHKLSDNHKVVSSKHAEGGAPSGADAMAHGPEALCNGGMNYADGGDVEQPTYWGAVKDRVKELTGLGGSSSTPAPTLPKAEQPKHGGKSYDDIVSEAETGKE
jgi:hypothetical protein